MPYYSTSATTFGFFNIGSYSHNDSYGSGLPHFITFVDRDDETDVWAEDEAFQTSWYR